MVDVKTKIFMIVTLIASVTLYYYLYYKKKNDPPATVVIPSIKDVLIKNLSKIDPQSYLYSVSSDKLYMKDKDGNFHDAGKGSDCKGIANTAVPLIDIKTTYNCSQPEAKANCGTDTDPTHYVSIVSESAKDYEKRINDSLSTPYVPDPKVCSTSSDTYGPFYVDPAILPPPTFPEYLSKNAKKIISMAEQMGEIMAISQVLGHFAIVAVLLPTFINGTPEEKIQAGIMSGQVILSGLAKDLLEFDSSLTAEEIEDMTEKGGGEMMDTAMIWVKQAGSEISEKIVSTVGREVLEAIPMISNMLMLVQMAGMILDMIDPCGLNNDTDTVTQDLLDKLKLAYDDAINKISSDSTYPNIWDASNNCDYDLNKAYTWNNCLTDEYKNTTTQKDFLAEDTALIQKYQNEYLDALKVNSYGQTIKKSLTNVELQRVLEINVGGDWSKIGKATKSDIKLPDSNALKVIDLLFTNNNVIVASEVNQHIYFIFTFVIILIVITFLL